MTKIEHDFLNWRSFPSSLKITNLERWRKSGLWSPWVSVTPGSNLTPEVMAKQLGAIGPDVSTIAVQGWDGTKEVWFLASIILPLGGFDWRKFTTTVTVPPNVVAIRSIPMAGSGSEENPTIVWFDDLKISQNGILLYENKFSKWTPLIIGGGLAILGGIGAVALMRRKRS